MHIDRRTQNLIQEWLIVANIKRCTKHGHFDMVFKNNMNVGSLCQPYAVFYVSVRKTKGYIVITKPSSSGDEKEN